MSVVVLHQCAIAVHDLLEDSPCQRPECHVAFLTALQILLLRSLPGALCHSFRGDVGEFRSFTGVYEMQWTSGPIPFFFMWIWPWMSQKVPVLRMREERACALREAESPLPCHFPGPPQAGIASRSHHCLSPCLTEATSCHKHLQQSTMSSELTCWVSSSDYSPRVLSLQGYFCLPSRPPQGLLGVLAHLCEPYSNLDTSSLSQTNPHIFLAFNIVTVKDTK